MACVSERSCLSVPRCVHTYGMCAQGLVNKLTDYGVPDGNILGIRYGFRGFYDKVSRTASPGQQLQA